MYICIPQVRKKPVCKRDSKNGGVSHLGSNIYKKDKFEKVCIRTRTRVLEVGTNMLVCWSLIDCCSLIELNISTSLKQVRGQVRG